MVSGVALLVGCDSDDRGETTASLRNARERLAPVNLMPSGAGPAVPPASRYRTVLHPYWLFLGFDRALIAENWQLSLCMRSRGWDRFPLLKGRGLGVLPLDLIQTASERARAATTYGSRSVSAESTGRDDFDLIRRFSGWLVEQPPAVRAKYNEDFSGGRSENDAPAKGSCKARVLRLTRPVIPSLDPAVEARAGALYERYITTTGDYRRARQAWQTCMSQHGFARVGPPLKVWRHGLDGELQNAASLNQAARARLADALTAQAVAEHECARGALDDVIRTGELRVVEALAEEFPRYAKLLLR
jgi:hypothetical protein